MTLFDNQAFEIKSIVYNSSELICRHCCTNNLATPLQLPKEFTGNMMVAKQRKQHLLSQYQFDKTSSLPTTTVYRQKGLRLAKTLKMNFNIKITDQSILGDATTTNLSKLDCCNYYGNNLEARLKTCLLYTSPSPRDKRQSRMPSSA